MIKNRNILVLFFALFFSFPLLSQTEKSMAEKGVLDLRGYNFDQNIELKGEWEFYWGQLLDYYDFENKVYTPDAYIKVPGAWSDVEVNGKSIPDTGYATFRLVLFLDVDRNQDYMLRFGEILTAYKVWWNNDVISEIGRVATNSTDGIPAMEPNFKSVKFDKEKVQIIIQISNYNHRTNGFFQTPVLGKEEKVIRATNINFFIDIFLFGAMIIMAFYHLGLFIMRRKNKAALAFFLLSFDVAIRTVFSSNYVFNYIFPEIPWEFVYRINYFTMYGMVASFVFFFQTTFNVKKFKLFFYLSYGFTGLYALTLFLPILIYTKLLAYYQIAVVLMILFSIYLMFRFIKEKRAGAVTLTITILMFFCAGINDILYFQDIIKTTTLTHVGTFVLILGQSLTLARIFTKSFKENEELTAKLDYQNQHLQELVEERTKEIEKQKQDILQKNEELIVQKEELQVQKEEILRHKELLEMHNELMTDSVNYASTIQYAILPSNENIKKYFNSFIIYLPKDIVSGDFYWFNDTNSKYVFLIVGDCTGHGVPGAFISLIVMYLLNSIVNEKNVEDPKQILNELEKMFNVFLQKGQNSNRDGVELGIMRFEKQNMRKVVYSAAKTNFFVFDSADDSLTRYRGVRKSIGLLMNNSNPLKFSNLEFNLTETQTIYCSTDGFVDQNNPERKRFGTTRFIDMIKENAKMPLQQQKVLFMKKLEGYKKGEVQRDDITFLGVAPKTEE
ncbi:MAG: SpoIIE family protein phosphatase [Bacteroidales bacterium]|nr:SpoIIE family protein phosphatase [Bacteroidales bacterium]